jgi:hypothetical protein
MTLMNPHGTATAVEWIRVIRTGVLYFAIVFAAGFALGVVRVLFVIPQLGARSAELIELPAMAAISYLSARWLIGRFQIPYTLSERIGVGVIALALLVGAELGVVVWLQKLSVSEYISSRDPISGTAYLLSVLLFALFPLIVRRDI